MQRSDAQARKASLADSVLAAISEIMPSVAAVDVEQDNFMDVGSNLYQVSSVKMELLRARNSPTNAVHTMEYLAANVELAKDLVMRCSAIAQDLMNDDLLGITEDLDKVIKDIAHEISKIPASAVGSNRFADAAVDAHIQVSGNRQNNCDQRSCDGCSEADLSIIVANDRPRRRTLHNSDMPRLVDFLQGMYNESHEFGGQSFSSLPEVAEYVEPLYDSFFCPLTNKVMVDPVTAESGVTYDRRAIEEYFDNFTDGSEPVVCPVTKMAMQSKTLRSNAPLKSTIAEWIMRNEATRVRIARTALSMATTEAMVLEALQELILLAKVRRKNRDQMHKIGITKFLARLLEHKDGLIRCDSLDLLCLLVEGEAGKEIIAKTRAIARTIKLLSTSSPDERHAAISFLVELSKSELLLENIGSTAGSILILTTMKFNELDDPIAAEKAGEVLKNLEKCPKNIKYMAESGYLDPLQRHLVEGSEDVQMEMVSYLGELVLKQEMTINIAGSASEILIKMVHSGNTIIRKAALDVLVQISSHHPNGKTLVDAGAVPVMVEELFIRKIDDEPMGSKTEAASVLANIVESGGLHPDSIVVNKEGHVLTSKYSVYNLVHMLKCSMPDNLNLGILRVLLALTALPKPLATVVSVMKEQNSSQTVIEFMGSQTEALAVSATRLLIALSEQMGHTIAEKLCKAPGQPGRLVKSVGQPGRVTERHAASAMLLARLPYQNIALNLALLKAGAVPMLLAKVEEMQRGEMRASRHAKVYMEGLVGALVRLTSTLYDPDVHLAAMDHSFTTVLADLVRSAGSDEVQRLAAVGLENLSHQSVNLSQPPSEDRLPNKKNILRRLREAHSGRKYNNSRKAPAHCRLCPVHRGLCSPATTFCLVEAGAVEGLVGVLESNEDGRVVEAVLGALCTLLDDAVDVGRGVAALTEHDAPRHVLRSLRQHRDLDEHGDGGAVLRRCFWAVERFLTHGDERCVREVTGDRVLPSALVSAYTKGDAATKQVAESVLRCLHRMPDYSASYVSVEL